MAREREFGKWLVTEGLVQPDGLRRALEIHESTQACLDTVLLDMGLVGEGPLLEALGRFHKTRTVSRIELNAISSTLSRTLSPRIAARLRVVPFRLEGKTLSVATLDPGDLLVEDELCVVSGFLIATYITLEVRLIQALSRLYELILPGHYEALISRLENTGMASPPAQAPDLLTEKVKVDEKHPVAEKMYVPHALRRKQPQHVDPLDLSAEELSLFPSLRANDEESADHAPAAPVLPRYQPPEADLSPEERLAATAQALQNAEMREDIADAVLGHCAPIFRRQLLLGVRKDTILGWRGEGDGVKADAVRALTIPASEPSVFLGLIQGSDFWLGPLPQMANNQALAEGLGGTPPSECFILPIRLREKTVCFLYFDNLSDGVGGLPMTELQRLAAKVSLAFQVYLMKSKIRIV